MDAVTFCSFCRDYFGEFVLNEITEKGGFPGECVNLLHLKSISYKETDNACLCTHYFMIREIYCTLIYGNCYDYPNFSVITIEFLIIYW